MNLFGRPTAGNCIDLDDITGRVVIYKVPDRKLRICRIDYKGCEKGVSNTVVRLRLGALDKPPSDRPCERRESLRTRAMIGWRLRFTPYNDRCRICEEITSLWCQVPEKHFKIANTPLIQPESVLRGIPFDVSVFLNSFEKPKNLISEPTCLLSFLQCSQRARRG